MTHATVYRLIQDRLISLHPTDLVLLDNSDKHANHTGNNGGCHLELHIRSTQFEGLKSLACHRLVIGLVADLIPYPIHALSIKILR